MNWGSKRVTAAVCTAAVVGCLDGRRRRPGTGHGRHDRCVREEGERPTAARRRAGLRPVRDGGVVERARAAGSAGPQGPQGAPGPQGPAGADAVIAPHEETRVLTLPAGNFNGIFGGKLCADGVLVSGGFSILMPNVKVTDSWIGEAFGRAARVLRAGRQLRRSALPAGRRREGCRSRASVGRARQASPRRRRRRERPTPI